jgi:hypothetical protein
MLSVKQHVETHVISACLSVCITTTPMDVLNFPEIPSNAQNVAAQENDDSSVTMTTNEVPSL